VSDGAIIFTTNYDRVPEYLCETLELPWTDGYEVGKVVSPWTGAFDEDVAIAKLHGSVTWYTDSDGSPQHLRLDRGYPLPGADFRLSRSGHDLDPLMIIPTLEKQTLGPPYNQLQNLFADALAKAKLLVVVGSSLRDDHLVGAIEFRRASLTVLLVGRQGRESAARLQNISAIPLEADSEDFFRFALEGLKELRESVASIDDKTTLDAVVEEFARRESTRIEELVTLSPELQEALMNLQEDKSVVAALEAIDIVRGSNHPTVTSALAKLLSSSSNDDLRLAAAGCLGQAKLVDAIPQLRTASMADSSPAVRLEAALALSLIGTSEAMDALNERRSARPDDVFIDSVLAS
jgi:hypothetical protein